MPPLACLMSEAGRGTPCALPVRPPPLRPPPLGPPPLAREGHLQVWLSYRDGTCALHCDEPNGVLICLGGERKVALLPPRVSIDTDAWVGTKPSLRYDVFADARFQEGGDLYGVSQVVTLTQGDALYIPSGWWHQVRSTRGSVGVSVPVTCAGNVGWEASRSTAAPPAGSAAAPPAGSEMAQPPPADGSGGALPWVGAW